MKKVLYTLFALVIVVSMNSCLITPRGAANMLKSEAKKEIKKEISDEKDNRNDIDESEVAAQKSDQSAASPENDLSNSLHDIIKNPVSSLDNVKAAIEAGAMINEFKGRKTPYDAAGYAENLEIRDYIHSLGGISYKSFQYKTTQFIKKNDLDGFKKLYSTLKITDVTKLTTWLIKNRGYEFIDLTLEIGGEEYKTIFEAKAFESYWQGWTHKQPETLKMFKYLIDKEIDHKEVDKKYFVAKRVFATLDFDFIKYIVEKKIATNDEELIYFVSSAFPEIVKKQNNQIEIVKYLIGKGFDINKANEYKNSPLLIASMYNHPELCKVLIKNGADTKQLNSYKSSFYHTAVMSKNIELVKYALTFGYDINKLDYKNRTALFIAVRNKNVEMVQFLIKKGVSLNQVSTKGETILDICRYDKVEKILIEAGAKSGKK
ncbi:MAG: ankyrin repeat domain-containing protein [Chlorobi bacterium]|nr:ankyrin repeat domain-containing protein [Chlorobiota bacterium]